MKVRIVHDDGAIIGVFDASADLSKFGDYKIEEWPVLDGSTPRWRVIVYKDETRFFAEPYYGLIKAKEEFEIYIQHFVEAKDEKDAIRKVLGP